MPNSLIVYFSLNETGSTAKVARIISEAVDGELFRIVPKKDYSKDPDELSLETKKEYQDAARPELLTYIDHIKQYDTIFLCYPLWWNTLPMPVFTFVEKYDFTNIKIVPFCTNDGGGIGFSTRELKDVCKNGEVLSGYGVKSSEVDSLKDKIIEWAKENI